MQRLIDKLEKVNILAALILAIMAGVIFGVLPVADGLDTNEAIEKLTYALIASLTLNSFEAVVQIIRSVEQINFKSEKWNKFFDDVVVLLNAIKPVLPPEPPTTEQDTVEVKPLAKFEAQG